MLRKSALLFMATGLALLTAATGATAQNAPSPGLKELSLAELANLEVTSVSRQAEPLADAPAAIFVITQDAIRRSGATTLAEALRLAPNLHVARTDGTQYGVSARGFNSAIANKLLVLVDGRTIYSPLFSGVFWDQQDVMLEDVERIEVISGPGATLWGTNAVNGVINVITRSARDTQGALVSIGGGNVEQVAAVRYGTSVAGHHVRVYGKTIHLDRTQRADGGAQLDDRGWLQGGFRADFGDGVDGFTLQGDAYRGRSKDRGSIAGFQLGRVELTGLNLLGRGTRRIDDRSDVQVKAYYVQYKREERILFQPDVHLADVEGQYAIRFGRHRLLTGAGYRRASDEVEPGILIAVNPSSRTLNWQSLFVEGDLKPAQNVNVSTGLRLERNDYTGWEYLPSARLGWKLAADQLLWGSVSRAVRAPARLDREVINPFGGVLGGPNFQSEVADVFELGYRGQPAPTLTSSVTVFLHDWDRLRSGTAVPVIIENRIEGTVHGVEVWATWQPVEALRIGGGLTAFRKALRLEPGSGDPVGIRNPQLANDPARYWTIRPSIALAAAHDLDVMIRGASALPNPAVPAYTAVDLRYGWRPRPDLELSLTAHNLFDDDHIEFGVAGSRTAFERGIFVQARWSR